MFNTAMLFELAVIKTQAEPLLEQVPESADEYNEAYRLLKFLKYIKPLSEARYHRQVCCENSSEEARSFTK